jgi:polysaccharide chain length determinant protein (PEP-CTERM system associated)
VSEGRANEQPVYSAPEVVHGILAAAWRRRALVAVPAAVLSVGGLALGRKLPKTFETRMSVLVATDDAKSGTGAMGDLMPATDLKDQMESLTALLQSRPILLSVAEDQGFIPKDATREAQDAAVGALAQSISVQLVGTDLLEFTYRNHHPLGMEKVLSEVGQKFINTMIAPNFTSSRESVEFLQKQLEAARKQMELAQAAISAFKGSHIEELPEQRGALITRLQQFSDQLKEREVALAGATSDLADKKARLAQTDPVIGRLEQQIVDAQATLATLRGKYTEEHSSVQAAERTLSKLEQEHASLVGPGSKRQPADIDQLWNMTAAAPGKGEAGHPPLLVSQIMTLQDAASKVAQLKAEVESLRGSVDEIRGKLATSGKVDLDLSALEDDLRQKSEAVDSLRSRYEKAKVTDDFVRYQAPYRFKVVNTAYEPIAPVKSYTLIFLAAGIVGGIGLGCGLAAASELVDQRVRTARAAERLAAVPVLARLA